MKESACGHTSAGTPRQCSPKQEIIVGLVNSLVLEMERSGMNLKYRIGATLSYSDRLVM